MPWFPWLEAGSRACGAGVRGRAALPGCRQSPAVGLAACRAAGTSRSGHRDSGVLSALTHGDIRVFSMPDRLSIWSPTGSGLTCGRWEGVEDFLPFCQAFSRESRLLSTAGLQQQLFAACFLFSPCPSTSPRQPPSV